ncbi:MAG: PQQ-binding-like beta-propeller repeat protein, partial [Planctomycetes bacterium]|nr:PQQ-binding-like beta-propeller repeat protein [Planctomycetota bacterium]
MATARPRRPSRRLLAVLVLCGLGPSPSPCTGQSLPEELAGIAGPRVLDEEGSKRLLAADAAARAKRWDEVLDLLDAALGPLPEEEAPAPRLDREGDLLVTQDGILYASVPGEVRRLLGELPPERAEAWRKKRGLESAGAAGAPRAEAPLPAPRGAWLGVLARPDHAALEVAPEEEWRSGSYARWVHRLKVERKLESSQPARNVYYSCYPMQAVALGDLVLVRSHQDVLALERETGDARWSVESDVPVAEQTIHQRGSGFSSWHYFSDIGGWALAAVPGEPERLIVVSRPGRCTVESGKVAFQRNELRAYDARSGALLWSRGGEEDEVEALREMAFAAPPTPAGAKGGILVAPAFSGDGCYAAAFTPSGELLWLERVYGFLADPELVELLDESMGLGSSLAASGDLVVGAPGHGLIFALDAPSGGVLWATRYPSAVRKAPSDPRWAPGHPVIAGGKAIAAPFDGDGLFALDLETGKAAWSRRLTGGFHALLGADGSRAYEVSSEGIVTATRIDGGATAWTSEPLGQPQGRGLVTSSRLYVPVARAIVVLDAARGTVLKRSRLWDERLPDPVPGNLFLTGGEMLLGAPWGFARLEPYEATRASIAALGLRDGLLRRARIAQAEGKYLEAIEDLKKVLASTSEEAAREGLRAELLQLSQEAAASTRDVRFIQRVLEEPDLIETAAHRTAFVLRSAEILEEQAPAEAARLYREIIADPPSGDLVVSPEGMLVDVGLYASEALRDLVTSGRAEPDPAEEDRLRGWIEGAASSEGGSGRLLAIALRWSHTRAVAAAHAHLARAAERAGDLAAAASHLARLAGDDPGLLEDPDLAAYVRGLGERAGPARAPAAVPLSLGGPWRRRFLGKSAGAELASLAEGSEPLPGVLVVRDGLFALLDGSGQMLWQHYLEGFPDLAAPRSRVQGTLVEPAAAFARGERFLVFTAAGLHEVLAPEGEPEAVRAWLALEHPLKRHAAPAAGATGAATVELRGGAIIRRVGSGPQRPGGKIAVPGDASFFPRLELDPEGNPAVLKPDGTVLLLEGSTGRIR